MNKFIESKITLTLEQLKTRMRKSCTLIDGVLMKECGYRQDNALPTPDESWRSFSRGDIWGKNPDEHCWFYVEIETLADNSYVLVKTGIAEGWDALNPQFVAYLDGELVQGLDINHIEFLVEKKGRHKLHFYAYSGMNEGEIKFMLDVVEYDEDARRLYYNIKVPFEVCGYLEPDEKKYIDIMGFLENAANLIDFRRPGADEDSIQAALNYLESDFYKKYCSKNKCEAEVVCIGHTHIDVAWLWTLSQTREKALRSFSTVIALMKKYPEYKFMSSQAQLYQYVKEQDEKLYEDIKAMVRAGRWEVEGAMWVEADCNLISGESMVRQILFGKRFFKQEFGVDSHVLWLPDVFGYSAAMPQILQKSGVDKFVTSKISWNESNTMPNDTFMWQGLDGTEIMTYFLTAQDKNRGGKPKNITTYNSVLTPSEVCGAWDRYQNKDISDEVLISCGYGDGGGGTTAEMLEYAGRLEAGIPGCPCTRFDTAANFLDKLEKKLKASAHIPKWVGELYLEFHRGTYTSMAHNKKCNRKSEYMYQTAELAAATDMLLCGGQYPQTEINSGWQTILLNQFHDIIPGSSIKEVYEESARQYAQIEADGHKLINAALDGIASNITTDGGVLVYNPLSFENSGIAEVDGKKFYAENIPPKGYKVLKNIKTENSVKVSENAIENRFFKIKLRGGDIVGIYDKQNKREVIKKGERANVLRAFEDYPKCYDNWEITSYYKDKMWEVNEVESVEKFDDGICAGLKIRKRFLNSVIEQKICLYDDIPRIDFDSYVDWKQDHILLKAMFPVDIHAEKAVYDIQFGTVERPTHRNTSWDAAKFEVCAHKFADLSEGDYGVSLMNDCKYGYDILGNEMSITLIKSGTYPNPDADKCEHRFVYSLYPHSGNHCEGKTIQQAFSLNVPMYARTISAQQGTLPEEYSLIKCNAENVIVDTVKKAEDSGGVVIRLYETYNRRTKVRLEPGFEVKECSMADMTENKQKQMKIKNGAIELEVRPFEIVTLIVE